MKTTRHITRAIPRSSFCILHSAFCIALAVSAARAATLPAGYTQLAYIESTGTQYIGTGHTPTPNFRAVVDFQFPSPAGGGGFGYGASANGPSFRLNRSVANGVATYTVNVHDTYATTDTFPTTFNNDTARHVADISNTSKSFDGVTFGRTSGLTKTLAATFYLFATRQGWTSTPEYASYRVFSCQLYDGDPQTLVRDFVPCTDEDGKPGLYDLVEGKMYYGKPAGNDFVLGPAVNPELLSIGSVRPGIGTSSPEYGDVTGLAMGDTVQCSAPAIWTNAACDTAATCAGWKLYDAYGVLVSNGASNAFTYTHPGSMRVLEWQWTNVEYRISATAGAGGAVSPAEQWVAHGGTATVTATADQGLVFLKWTGAPTSVIYANPAAFVVTVPREMAARFGDLRMPPAGYRRVAYIESTGTQYLDTGFTPTRYARIVVDFQFPLPTGGGSFGSLGNSGAQQSFWFWRSVADGVSTFAANVNNTLGMNTTASAVDVFPATFTNDTARHVADLSDPAKSFDGVQFGRTSGLTKTLAGSLYLFAAHWGWSPYVGNYGSYRVYSFKFYESGNLVGYLLPCTDGNGKPCLYDTVNWEPHYNQAKGADFLRGPTLPFGTILLVQ